MTTITQCTSVELDNKCCSTIWDVVRWLDWQKQAQLVVTVHNAGSVKVQQEPTHEPHGDTSLHPGEAPQQLTVSKPIARGL